MPPPSPAKRAKARRHPAVGLPPKKPLVQHDIAELTVRTRAGEHLIGPRVKDGVSELTMRGASQYRLDVWDHDGQLEALLSDETERLADGIRITVDGVIYVLGSDGREDDLASMIFEDEAAWRFKRQRRYRAWSRGKHTRAEAVYAMVEEESRKPRPPLAAFIPELTDRQRIVRAAAPPARTASAPAKTVSTRRPGVSPAQSLRRGDPGRPRGTGSAGGYTVKGVAATAQQTQAIDAILTEADRLGGSRRVLIACIMCTTGESNIAPLRHGDAARNDTIGYFQQGPEWINPSDTRNPTLAVRAFLISPKMPSRGWKGSHGSLKNGSGNLARMIHVVQDNADPNYFAPFEAEATKTVDAWLGDRPAGAGGSLSTGRAATTSRERTTAVSYLFERGSRDGERESSWDCSGRLAEQVKWARWAALNTIHFVSEEELRAAAPSLEVHGDEEWLLARPAYQRGGVGRPTQEVTLRVLSDTWGVLPGAVVLMAGQGALDGRWLVDKVTDPIRSQESDVVIVRPTPKLPEPAHETRTSTTTTTTPGDGSSAGGSSSGGGDSPGKLSTPVRGLAARGWPGPGGAWGAARSYGGHAGVDIPSPFGQEWLAMVDATVVAVTPTWVGGSGCVVLKPKDRVQGQPSDVRIGYGGTSSISVRVGQSVGAGQVIGRGGTHGSGPHLHLFLRRDDTPSNGTMNPTMLAQRAARAG